MGRITSFQRQPSTAGRPHSEVECGWHVVHADGGQIVQIDTFGSSDRKNPGKVSQSIQLGARAAQEIMAILREVFGAL